LQIRADWPLHLTYCTNIHAADGWAAVRSTLERFAPQLKARFSPNAPFGVGLRLSAREARELLDGGLDEFRAFLDREGLYVAIINGFPHGSFHRSVVKADVYAPDWRDKARVDYTSDLIDILSALLPAGLDGGISTVPLSYKAWMRAGRTADWETITTNVIRIAEKLVRLRQDRGVLIHLDIEPEPDCVMENTPETVEFFDRWLVPRGTKHIAERDLLDHIRICFDCCHFSVEHEDPRVALKTIEEAGIRIGRIQLSSALRAVVPPNPSGGHGILNRLRPFADSTYLHQVIRKTASGVDHYPDLYDAIEAGGPGEWRIHFHVPLFTSEYEGLHSTQNDVQAVLAAVTETQVTTHLEIETYTWDVLPGNLKIDLLESIAREYEWVLETLKGKRLKDLV